MGNITYSKKHGLNPSIPVCFFCGKEKPELVLFGKLKHDAEAPHHVVMDYVPCDKCRDTMEKGITFIAVKNQPQYEHQIAIQKDYYPTGQYGIFSEPFIRTVIEESALPSILANKMAYTTPEGLQKLIDLADKSPSTEQEEETCS